MSCALPAGSMSYPRSQTEAPPATGEEMQHFYEHLEQVLR